MLRYIIGVREAQTSSKVLTLIEESLILDAAEKTTSDACMNRITLTARTSYVHHLFVKADRADILSFTISCYNITHPIATHHI